MSVTEEDGRQEDWIGKEKKGRERMGEEREKVQDNETQGHRDTTQTHMLTKLKGH